MAMLIKPYFGYAWYVNPAIWLYNSVRFKLKYIECLLQYPDKNILNEMLEKNSMRFEKFVSCNAAGLGEFL